MCIGFLLCWVGLGLNPARAAAQEDLVADFQDLDTGGFGLVGLAVGEFFLADRDTGGDPSSSSYLEVSVPRGDASTSRAIRIPGGVARVMELRFPRAHLVDGPAPGLASVSFLARRDGRTRPFALTAILLSDTEELARHTLESQVVAAQFQEVVLELPPGASRLQLEHTAPDTRGLWVDDVILHAPRPMEVVSASFQRALRPLVMGELSEVGTLVVSTVGTQEPCAVTSVAARLVSESGQLVLREIEADLESAGLSAQAVAAEDGRESQAAPLQTLPLTVVERFPLHTGRNEFQLFARVAFADSAAEARPWGLAAGSARVEVALGVDGHPRKLTDDGSDLESWAAVSVFDPDPSMVTSIALVNLAPGKKSTAGAVTSDRGAGGPLVALIGLTARSGRREIVLARSADGGRVWETEPFTATNTPGELSRPTLVHDPIAGVLHLFASWDPEGTPRYGPGFEVGETPQVVRFESHDEGRTWTDAVTVTGDLKDESSSLLRPAGGRGIRTDNGALVVPFVTDRAMPPLSEPSGAVAVSVDAGRSWRLSSRAFMSTGRGAVYEARANTIVLNMTDLRGLRRNVRYSADLGESWAGDRLRRRSSLLCAGGTAAVLHVNRELGRGAGGGLVFLNAAVERRPARDMKLRGTSPTSDPWADGRSVLLDDGRGVASPALAMLDAERVLAVYASSTGDVVAQVVPLARITTPPGSIFDVTGGR